MPLSTQLPVTGRWTAVTMRSDEATILVQPDVRSRLWAFFATWAPNTVQPAITAGWVLGDPYSVEQYVRHNGKVYWARLEMLASTADDEPGVGGEWETYWGGGEVNYVAASEDARLIVPTANLMPGAEVYVECQMTAPGPLGGGVAIYDDDGGLALHSFGRSDTSPRTVWLHLRCVEGFNDGTVVWQKLAYFDSAEDAAPVYQASEVTLTLGVPTINIGGTVYYLAASTEPPT